jgi:hypothetical protein
MQAGGSSWVAGLGGIYGSWRPLPAIRRRTSRSERPAAAPAPWLRPWPFILVQWISAPLPMRQSAIGAGTLIAFAKPMVRENFAALQRKYVEALLTEKATPHAARHFLKALRGVVAVALRAGLARPIQRPGFR